MLFPESIRHVLWLYIQLLTTLLGTLIEIADHPIIWQKLSTFRHGDVKTTWQPGLRRRKKVGLSD